MPAQRRYEPLHLGRFAGQRYPAVALDPVRLGAGQDFQHGLAHDVFRLQAGQPLERRVDGQKAVIDRLAPRVAEDFMQGKTVQHLLEEGLIALLGPLAFGDVREGGVHAMGLAFAGEKFRDCINHQPAVLATVRMTDPHDYARDGFAGTQRYHGGVVRAGKWRTILMNGLPGRIHAGFAAHLIQRQAKNPFGSGIGGGDAAFSGLINYPLRHGLEQGSIALFALVPHLLDPLVLGDVMNYLHDADEVAVLVFEGHCFRQPCALRNRPALLRLGGQFGFAGFPRFDGLRHRTTTARFGQPPDGVAPPSFDLLQGQPDGFLVGIVSPDHLLILIVKGNNHWNVIQDLRFQDIRQWALHWDSPRAGLDRKG